MARPCLQRHNKQTNKHKKGIRPNNIQSNHYRRDNLEKHLLISLEHHTYTHHNSRDYVDPRVRTKLVDHVPFTKEFTLYFMDTSWRCFWFPNLWTFASSEYKLRIFAVVHSTKILQETSTLSLHHFNVCHLYKNHCFLLPLETVKDRTSDTRHAAIT